jgi:Na+/H+-dicarboxylate symporter
MLAKVSSTINRPSVSITAVVLGIWLGTMRFPFLQYLRPLGDFYVGLLQMCVLPFLLATIPLAVRSALTSGTGGTIGRRLGIWLLVTVSVVALLSVFVPASIFKFMPLDESTSSRIGTLVGASTDRVDIEFDLNLELSGSGRKPDSGILSIVPTNIFSALSSNDSLRVIVFAVIFGLGMVMCERRSGTSIFSALRHIQSVCIMIFDWFNLLVPIGIVALIAPQIALLGPDVFSVLTPFVYAYLTVSALLLLMPIVVMAAALRLDPRIVFAKMLRPLALVIATRNALVCAPTTLETLKDELRVPGEPCELYIPIGFVVMRFGPMVHFATSTLFIGYLLGRSFDIYDLSMVAALSVMASFATIGISGVAGLAPMAAVLRPFGLSYELALPLMVILDPIAAMVRAVMNVSLNSQIPVLAAAKKKRAPAPAVLSPAE